VVKLVLTTAERKELESLIKAAIKNAKVPIGLARRMMPIQGNIEEFAYGLISGMIIGNFVERFSDKNGRQPDRVEMADLFLIMMSKMPNIRKAIMNELGSA
jgi:hypothetical protein